ncbi:hypothetical protein JCM3770_002847 [Rhodotorula araucariae]
MPASPSPAPLDLVSSDAAARLAQLESLLAGHLFDAAAPVSAAAPSGPTHEPPKKRKRTTHPDTRIPDAPEQRLGEDEVVAFRLFSTHKAPQKVVLREAEAPPPVVLDPRIRDIDDEAPGTVEARRTAIGALALDGETILSQARTLPPSCFPPNRLTRRTLSRSSTPLAQAAAPRLAYLNAVLPPPLHALSPHAVPFPEALEDAGEKPPQTPHVGLLAVAPLPGVYSRAPRRRRINGEGVEAAEFVPAVEGVRRGLPARNPVGTDGPCELSGLMASRNSTVRASSSTSWLGSLATGPTADLRFSTFAVTGAKGSPRRKLAAALFDEDIPAGRESGELRGLRGLEGAETGWIVTVAEGPKARSRSRKPDPTVTIYVSTPTSSLTLLRKLSEVVDLDARLRAQFPQRLPPPTPAGPALKPKKRNSVLASLTRSLSPRRSASPSFTSLSVSKAPPSATLRDFGAALSAASSDPAARAQAAWQAFFTVRGDDLQSAHVERRIKRARSDETMHLAPAPALAVPPKSSLAREERQEPSAAETSASAVTEELVEAVAVSADRQNAHSLGAFGELVRVHKNISPVATVTKDEIVLDLAANESAPMDVSGEVVQADQPAPEPTLDEPVGENDAPAASETVLAEDAGPNVSLVPAPAAQVVETPHTREPSAPGSTEAVPSSLAPSSAMSASESMTRSTSNMSAATTVSQKSRAITLDSFEILRVLGKGCAGKVLLVKRKGTSEYLALKAITKRHVLAHRELAHTRTEQAILKRFARDQSNPFVVKLHYSFHDHETLYLALDFHPGGDLATQLARWGRLGRDRARFYISEIIDGVAALHRSGIIYRDLKPENILISADGHIVLTDFGLSKDFGVPAPVADGLPTPHWLGQHSRSASTPPGGELLSSFASPATSPFYTSTFCGTSEYLSPEVLLGQNYTFSTDWFSAGTLLYEMLAGVTPFWAEDHATMYRRVLHDKLTFDVESRQFDDDTKSLLRGMLQRDPLLRITHARMVRHPYFEMISWEFIRLKRYQPPFVPKLNPDDPTDTSQFEDMFLALPPQVKGDDPANEPGGERDAPEGEPEPAVDDDGRDVFDGYSYFGRDSASIHREDLDATEDSDGTEAVSCISGTSGDSPPKEGIDHPVAGAATPPARANADVDAEHGDSKVASPATTVDGAPSTEFEQPDDDTGATNASPAAPLGEDAVRFLTSTPPRTASPTNDTNVDTKSTCIVDQPTAEVLAAPDPVRTRQPSAKSTLDPLPEEHAARLSETAEIVVEEVAEDAADSDWDVVAREDAGGFVRNGGREATLWQRGFRDRYRLVLMPLALPPRPPPSARRRSSQQQDAGFGSSSSAVSSLQVSPAATPEPPTSPRPGAMRRLTSMRLSTSAKVSRRVLRTKGSLDASLYASADRIRSAPATPHVAGKRSKQSLAPSTSSSLLDRGSRRGGGSEILFGPPGTTPRKAGQAMKRLAQSAFLSNASSQA